MDEDKSQRRRLTDKVLLDPFALELLLLLALLGFATFVFLPAIVEILKPRDKGPRRILKKPLHKRIRSGAVTASISRQSLVHDASGSDLTEISKETGVQAQRIGKDTLRFPKDVVVPAKFEVWDNIIVKGNLTVGDDCVFHGNAKAYGDIFVGNSVIVHGNLVSKLNVKTIDDVVIVGSVHAEGSIELGERVFVGLSVVAGGDVELYENSEVKKHILASGVIRVLRGPKLDFPSTVQDIG